MSHSNLCTASSASPGHFRPDCRNPVMPLSHVPRVNPRGHQSTRLRRLFEDQTMNTYNVAYGLNGVQYCLLIDAKTAEDAERAARRIVPDAEYYYAEDIGE